MPVSDPADFAKMYKHSVFRAEIVLAYNVDPIHYPEW